MLRIQFKHAYWLWPLSLALLAVVERQAPAQSLHRPVRDGYSLRTTVIPTAPIGQIPFAALPAEAQTLTMSICHWGHRPHVVHHDGAIFHNAESRLPPRQMGYYHEYTVPTPGLYDRGARRIIVGGTPPQAGYYTADHYQTFQRVALPAFQSCRP